MAVQDQVWPVALERRSEAVRCGPLAEVLRGATAPLTASRFADNIGVALSTRSLRVAKDPVQARRELCG